MTRPAARCSLSTLLLVTLMTGATSVFAQPKGKPPEPAPAGSSEASERFRAGVAFYKDGDFPAALVEFKRAYELAPNYRVLFNLGQTSQELNEYADALKAFDQYLAEGGKEVDAAKRAKVQSFIDQLKKKVGKLMIKTNVEGAEIVVDDVSVGKTPLEGAILVNAGRRKLSATLSGYVPVQRAIEVAGSDEKTLELEMVKVAVRQDPPKPDPPKPDPPKPKEIPVAAWVMLAATGASGVVTGVMGGLALGARGDLDAALATFPGDAAAIEDAQNRTRSFAIATDVMTGVTVAAATTTVVLFVVALTSTDETPADETPASAALRVTPTGFSISGAF